MEPIWKQKFVVHPGYNIEVASLASDNRDVYRAKVAYDVARANLIDEIGYAASEKWKVARSRIHSDAFRRRLAENSGLPTNRAIDANSFAAAAVAAWELDNPAPGVYH